MNIKKDRTISLKNALDVDEYYSRHDDENGEFFLTVIKFVLGMVFGMVLLSGARSCDKQPEPVTTTLKCHPIDCRDCHGPIARNYRENKIIQKARINYNKRVLADLVRP